MSDVDAPTATLSGVVVVLLVDFLRQHRAWGWMRMVQGPSALKNTPGLLFAKVMGSGHDGGFGLRPSASLLLQARVLPAYAWTAGGTP